MHLSKWEKIWSASTWAQVWQPGVKVVPSFSRNQGEDLKCSTVQWCTTNIWNYCCFSHSLSSQTNSSAVSQWVLLYSDFGLQLETSEGTKGVEIPSTAQCERATAAALAKGDISSSEPQVWQWCFRGPLHFPQPHKTAAGRQADKTPNPTQNVILSEENFTFSAKKEQTVSQSALNLIRHVIFRFYRWKCH